MELELLETVGKAAGIGGIAIGALILVFRETLRKAILPKLTRQQAYRLLTLTLVLVWTVALAGIGAWILGGGQPNGPSIITEGDNSPVVQGVDGNVEINVRDE